MTILHAFMRRYWPDHAHLVDVIDIATGVPLANGNIPLTAFKFRCRLCGHEHVDVCRYGIEQLQAGCAAADVMQWGNEGRGVQGAAYSAMGEVDTIAER